MSNSKMNQAEVVYNKVHAEDFDLQGKSARSAFLELAMSEVGLTKAGASTYYQNLRNKHVNNKGLYEYNKTASKSTEPKAEKVKKTPKVTVLEEPKAYVPEHRWTVSVDGKVVNSFPSRAKAQAEAKALGGKWGDVTKVA